jgi:UTP--glucose-1-phosphate uridylyltransferase
VDAATEKMRAAGLPEVAVESFARYRARLEAGEQGTLPESEIEPVDSLPDAEDLRDDPRAAARALGKAVVIKLNGGLGTSMGMSRAKSLLEVKEGLTFLDVIARQVLGMREGSRAGVPLVLMNSFATRDDSLAALSAYPDLEADLPLDFLQGRVPKLREDDLEPVSWPADPKLEWAPPGHGDLYTALAGSGMLGRMLERGYEYAFVSNSDNLGATLDPRILAWFARERLPFLMEAADRTPSDRKGGHLARRPGGGLVLREIAQTPEEDQDAFQDVERHRYFNCNTLWVNLRSLSELLERSGGAIELPMIVNRKTVDPADPASTPVIQLETAMGAAIDVFEGAAALRVPRSRFVPVKTTADLLSLRSDAYVMSSGQDRPIQVELAPERGGRPPVVELDPEHYKLVPQLEERFPSGPPSLLECERLSVHGDVRFGAHVTVRGTVELTGPLVVGDGAVLG